MHKTQQGIHMRTYKSPNVRKPRNDSDLMKCVHVDQPHIPLSPHSDSAINYFSTCASTNDTASLAHDDVDL